MCGECSWVQYPVPRGRHQGCHVKRLYSETFPSGFPELRTFKKKQALATALCLYMHNFPKELPGLDLQQIDEQLNLWEAAKTVNEFPPREQYLNTEYLKENNYDAVKACYELKVRSHKKVHRSHISGPASELCCVALMLCRL